MRQEREGYLNTVGVGFETGLRVHVTRILLTRVSGPSNKVTLPVGWLFLVALFWSTPGCGAATPGNKLQAVY